MYASFIGYSQRRVIIKSLQTLMSVQVLLQTTVSSCAPTLVDHTPAHAEVATGSILTEEHVLVTL